MIFNYGNSKESLKFKVRVTSALLNELKDFGFLDEDFDNEEYFNNNDCDWEMDSQISDAIIDYYEAKADSKLDIEFEKIENGEDYDESYMDLDSDIQRVEYIATFDNFRHLDHGCELVRVI